MKARAVGNQVQHGTWRWPPLRRGDKTRSPESLTRYAASPRPGSGYRGQVQPGAQGGPVELEKAGVVLGQYGDLVPRAQASLVEELGQSVLSARPARHR